VNLCIKLNDSSTNNHLKFKKIKLTDSSCMSPSVLLLLVVVVVNATAAVVVGADEGLDERLIAPTEPLPLTSDEPSMQSILDSDS
jgi:hypothetical protein